MPWYLRVNACKDFHLIHIMHAKLYNWSAKRFAVDYESRHHAREIERAHLVLRHAGRINSRREARHCHCHCLGEDATAARPTTVCENYCCHLPPALFLAAVCRCTSVCILSLSLSLLRARARARVGARQRCNAPQRRMMNDANLGARIMAASRLGLEALLNTTENFITVPRHEFSVELTTRVLTVELWQREGCAECSPSFLSLIAEQ